MIKLTKERTFRRTPGVHFADIGVPGSNGLDLVEHSGPSVSPPDRDGKPQWYVHAHQADNNRVVQGFRLFELFNERWVDPHWFVLLTPESGALHVPPGCLHRSYSGKEGSLLLNHAIRDEEYDENQEFHPVQTDAAGHYTTCYYGCTPAEVKKFIEEGTL